MANDDDDAYDPQGGRKSPDTAGGQREIIPWQHGSVDTPLSQPRYPTGREAPKPPIPVQRRTLSIMMGTIVALLLVVGGLAFAALSSSNAPAAAAPSVSSPSPSTMGTTDAAANASPSPEVSVSPSGTFATDTSTPGSTNPSVTDSPSDTAGPSGSFSPPFGSQPLGDTVDGSVYTRQDEHISNVDYPDSVGLYCPTSRLIDWNVAGFATFTAVFGIPDDARSATGIINTVTFSDQNGHQLGVAKTALGQPTQIRFALKGAARLVMSCDRQGSNDSTNNFVALGNPVLSVS